MDLKPLPAYYFYIVVTSIVLVAFGIAAVSKGETRRPGRLQMSVEMLMESLRDTFMGALGPGGERHLPLVFTLFWYILFCNMLELIPGYGAATANPSNTIGLGIIVFFYTQYVGIKSKGLGNYLKHFMGPVWQLVILFLPIEIIGEFVKPFSLGMRLFGNIYAEDLINDLAAKAGAHYFIPFQLIVYFLQIFTGLIQAFIFALLSCAYIGLMAETHDDGHEHSPEDRRDANMADSIGSIGGRVVESTH